MRQAIVVATVMIWICLAGDVAPVMADGETQQGAAVCNYPRLNALATSLVPAVATSQTRLDALATQFDAVTLGISSEQWLVAGTGRTVTEYLAVAKPQMARWVYIPAGFVWSGSFDCANHPAICGWQHVVTSEDWLRSPTGDFVTIGDRNNHVLNPTVGAFGRSAAYWAGWLMGSTFTGVHADVVTTTLDSNGGFVDTDGDQVSDRSEYGLAWLDAVWRAGQTDWLGAVAGTGINIVGNGAWQPGNVVYQPYLTGAFIEIGHHWRDPVDGAWKPSKAAVLGWQWEQAQAWLTTSPGDTLQWVASKTLVSDAYWSQRWNDYADAVRVAFAMAALSNGELVLESRIMPDWCDECGVIAGSTSTSGGDWLGCPRGDAVCSGGVCQREFDGGWVALNMTDQMVRLDAPAGLRTIRGWYDRLVNHGGAWDGVLPSQSAQILVRVGSPKPMPTATPTRTPTATPTRTLAERVSALETAVFGPQ